MKEKATIFDYARMCEDVKTCSVCPLGFGDKVGGIPCDLLIRADTDKANEIILNWCKEHPVETRQDRFLKMFPNAPKMGNGLLEICPRRIDTKYEVDSCGRLCDECYKAYWLAEVEENE